MVKLRWIQKSLFLMLLLQFTGANGWCSLLIRSGHDVTLPCENVINDQNKCDGTSWIFSGSRRTEELIKLGRIGKYVGVKSDRLSVTENCSLVIKKVTDEDVGRYVCQQFNKSGQKRAPDSVVLLSVVSLTEQKNNDEVTLNCSVSTYEPCRRKHRVWWLFYGRLGDAGATALRKSESLCSAFAHFKTSHFIYPSRFDLFECQVTYGDKVQLFSFITGPSDGGKTAAATTTTTTTTTTATTTGTTAQSSNNVDSTELNTCSGCSAVNYIMLVLRVVEVLLITLITVLLFRASGNQRPSDDHTVKHDEDEDEGVVKYENFGDSSASVVLH